MSVQENAIYAYPTKGFFIEMLTRDIRLDRAIIDLIDNCIDGAKTIKSDENYDGLEVQLSLSGNGFEIRDNCGGFSLHTAINYAFRFGRPKEPNAKFVNHSIGRFGVGMKRALFKMGRHFLIESRTDKDHFIVEIDVDEWIKDERAWNFSYMQHKEIPKEKRKLETQRGTVITVTKLYESIKNDFDSLDFQSKLKREISLALSYSLLKKLTISLNKILVTRSDIAFLQKGDLKPLFFTKKIQEVDVQIYAGVGDYSPSQAGWYVFCNDRMVLEADKTFTTGWKVNKEDEGNIIKYHNDYAMFRGVIFFDAADSNKLPMTTTKTGIDSDHPAFKSARPLMLTAMKQVVNFLRKIENKEEGESIINNSNKIEITKIRSHSKDYSEIFIFPTTKSQKEANKYVGISYKKERDLVDKVKDFVGVSTSREVGEATFNYFCKMNDLN